MAAALTHAIAARTLRTVAHRLAHRDLSLSVDGLAHLPRDGPCIVAARHVHHLYDGVALLHVVPRTLGIMVALDWVRDRRRRRIMETATRLARWPVVLRTDALTVGADGNPRNTGGAFRADEAPTYHLRAMRAGLEILRGDGAVLIFPEAYPNVDPAYTPKETLDEMLPFRRGFASLAGLARAHHGLRVPIVPVGLRYRRGPRWDVHVSFGAAFRLGEEDHPSTLIDEATRRVAALSGLPAPGALPAYAQHDRRPQAGSASAFGTTSASHTTS